MPDISEYFPGIKEGLVTLGNIEIADLGDLLDANGNEILEFDTVASAVANVRVVNAATGNNPIIIGVGETNAGLTFQTSGTGSVVVDQDGNGVALEIDTEATTTVGLDINNPTQTTAAIVQINDANALTTGGILNLISDSSSTSTRSLVTVTNDNTLATGATVLALTQDAAIECMSLALGTLDVGFFNFTATADADATSAISTLNTSGTTTDHIQVEINGTTAWIAVSTTDPT